jgi:adenylate cyclase, class 2
MEIEYEATFYPMDKDEIRARLKKAGAKLVKAEFLQKRVVFNLPGNKDSDTTWLRVRDECDKITMSLKKVSGDTICDQKELCLEVDDFSNAILFLESIGCLKKAYQENKRELWELDNVELMIDEWPFLEPYLEIEGKSEDDVKKVSEKLGFLYRDAMFIVADGLYFKKYGVSREIINNKIPLITFDMKNPFLKF